MARKWTLACIGVVLALGVAGVSAGALDPILRSAKAERHHVVVRIEVGDLTPIQFVAAKSRIQSSTGALLAANVKDREAITLPTASSGVVRWRSHKSLPSGTYYVQVMAVEEGGVTDCPPSQRPCGDHWSNVRRVVVP